jgi:uncharacterized protein YbcV (DUF1398 family)
MDASEISRMAKVTLEGSMPFPQVVAKLLSSGVEYYHVDFATCCFTFYGASGEAVVAPLLFPNLPPIAESFDSAELKAAILDSQQHGQKFAAFCTRATSAGVQGYFAFLAGKRVCYFGRQGDHHVEWFPGAGPTNT